MKILLTNDDSHRSPLLALLINFLRDKHELVVVVPKEEQSWRSKCITRFGYIHKECLTIADYPCFTIDGTPADCVNAGIHHFFSGAKPDLVVSGINAGLNIGTGFIWSSGTVGACLEANICGIPAVAFSQEFDADTRNRYAAEYALDAATLQRISAQTMRILQFVFDRLVTTKMVFERKITWNINFPFKAKEPLQVMPCHIAQSRYGNCFKRIPFLNSQSDTQIERFEHDLTEVYPNALPGTDAFTLHEGYVTVTPLDISTFGQLSEADKLRLATLFSG